MPTVTLPSPSMRAHSWDFMNFRSPGISLIAVLRKQRWWRVGVASVAKARGAGSNALGGLAAAHEGPGHDAHRDFAAADVDAHLARLAGRDPGEGDRLAHRGRVGARQDLALAAGCQHLLAVAQDTLLVHHQADHLEI